MWHLHPDRDSLIRPPFFTARCLIHCCTGSRIKQWDVLAGREFKHIMCLDAGGKYGVKVWSLPEEGRDLLERQSLEHDNQRIASVCWSSEGLAVVAHTNIQILDVESGKVDHWVRQARTSWWVHLHGLHSRVCTHVKNIEWVLLIWLFGHPVSKPRNSKEKAL